MDRVEKMARILISVCALALLQADAASLYPDITVLSSDEQGITFEFRPRFLPEEKISAESGEFLLPRFEYGFNPINSATGSEDIRARVITTALPGIKGNSLSIIASDFETISNFSIAPVPEVRMADDMDPIQKKYKPRFSLGQNYYPQNIALLKNVAVVKGIVTGEIVVTPFQYQASTKTLRKYSRIVLRIDYGAKENIFSDSKNDQWAQSVLLNYPIAKKWMRQKTIKKTAAADSRFSTGTWYKVEVAEDGMYKIDASYLRSLGIVPSELNSIRDVKVFGSDGKKIPEIFFAPRPADLPQVAVYYADQNGNSKFDDDDYLLFYGQGVTGWNYNNSSREFTHYTNCYTNSNYYFIGIGIDAPEKIMDSIALSGAPSGTPPIDWTTAMIFFDEEKFNFNQSGQNWVSAPLNSGETKVITNRLHGRISGTSITYKFRLYSRADVKSTFTVREWDADLGGTRNLRAMNKKLELDYSAAIFAVEDTGRYIFLPNSLPENRSNLKFTYNAPGYTEATGYIDWVELIYQRGLAIDADEHDELLFNSPDSFGIVEYKISNFSTSLLQVFDVSTVTSVRKMRYRTIDVTGTIFFQDSLPSGTIKKYWVGTPAAYRSPKSFVKIPNSNLRGYPGAEFIIVTHNEFKNEAQRLKKHKESLPVPISTVVVDVDTIYNEFGIGMPDPSAVRDFLKYAFDNWAVKPGYVLFFGDASYDYKSILGNDKSWVPTFETEESNSKINSYSNEDFFSYISSFNTVSIAHGRLCPRSASDAAFLVDRIINYETNQTAGLWKNTITVVGDDVLTTEPHSYEPEHTQQADNLASLPSLKAYEVKKIYIGEYATLFTSGGSRRKPDARLAIINQVNNGTVLINYTGHGNPKVWAHEYILTIDDVKTQFTNSDKLTFVVAATCDWGRFDEAGAQSSAEEILVNKKGGAIGVFSATRAVYSGPNFEINEKFYHDLFDPATPLPLGDVVLETKKLNSDLVNKQKYFLLGDPTLTLAIPKMQLAVDSINAKSTTAIADTIKLRSLEKTVIEAAVKNSDGLPNTDYNGTALVTVYDSDRLHPYTEMPGSFTENGAVIYRGENTISQGKLKATFIVPKDISYENKSGRISIYFSNDSIDGRGYTTNFIVGGTNSQAGSDSIGPILSIFFNTPSFQPGDVVTENPTLIVDLNDSSGINSSGSAIGHRVEAWIDDSPKSIDLTDYYKGKTDSYQEGTVEYTLTNISTGRHTIKVRAWDVYNNSAIAESYFVVASGDGLSIQNVYNFPNPFYRTTAFTFQHNQSNPIDVTIKVYSVTGRLIHTIERYGINEPFVTIPWDRRDKDGDEVGNGIYLYKVIAKTIDGKYSSEALGKLAIVR